MLGRQQVYLELSDDMEEFDELTEIMSNTHLNNNFLALAREVRCLQLYVNYFFLWIFLYLFTLENHCT